MIQLRTDIESTRRIAIKASIRDSARLPNRNLRIPVSRHLCNNALWNWGLQDGPAQARLAVSCLHQNRRSDGRMPLMHVIRECADAILPAQRRRCVRQDVFAQRFHAGVSSIPSWDIQGCCSLAKHGTATSRPSTSRPSSRITFMVRFYPW